MSKYVDQIKDFYPSETTESAANSFTMLDSKRASLDGAVQRLDIDSLRSVIEQLSQACPEGQGLQQKIEKIEQYYQVTMRHLARLNKASADNLRAQEQVLGERLYQEDQDELDARMTALTSDYSVLQLQRRECVELLETYRHEINNLRGRLTQIAGALGDIAIAITKLNDLTAEPIDGSELVSPVVLDTAADGLPVADTNQRIFVPVRVEQDALGQSSSVATGSYPAESHQSIVYNVESREIPIPALLDHGELFDQFAQDQPSLASYDRRIRIKE